jgi:hypothetical protein
MQATRALLQPVARHLRGIFGKDGGLIHVALFQAHAMAVFEVDSRYEQHGYWQLRELIKG